ncbi:aspartyl-phosphate phosphatase Spo0E family protein [Paenibacillus hamazuiensis]|uniref:aspartyl-phosphate phosphatase Spo0E family protein n=1 Tax=Paenibacillus hamazuiensis TaxID=2936508 RepID=UPI00200C7B88|nr:aspartyl-phosphate phosphatase Spo0E family protein [Paenibacillus hamazuiensis]
MDEILFQKIFLCRQGFTTFNNHLYYNAFVVVFRGMESYQVELYFEEKIEELRLQMVEEAMFHGSFANERVIELSQRLDKYIVMLQKIRKKTASQQAQKQSLMVVG